MFIPVSDDAYRFDLVKNREMTSRYGRLEYTSRSNGLDTRIKVDDIENWDVFGLANKIDSIQVVDKSLPYSGSGDFDCYTPYWKGTRFKGNTCRNAEHSMISLIESLNITSSNVLILKHK